MILSYMWNKVPEENKEDIAAGLALGLAFGLAFGLVTSLALGLAFGLAAGLAFGLAVGLVFSLAVGLVFSLAAGLTLGLTFSLAAGLAFGLAVGLIDIITSSFEHSIILLFIILIISEILYWVDKNKLNNDMGRWIFTLIKKGEALLETSIILVNSYLLVKYSGRLISFISSQGETIHMILQVIGYGTVIVLIIVGYVWFNSLKYKGKNE